VPLGKRIDLDKLTAARDQLFAEAAYEEAQGASIRMSEELWEYAGVEPELRGKRDPWEDLLLNIQGEKFPAEAGCHEQRVHSDTILHHHLGLSSGELTMSNRRRSKRILVHLGWTYRDNLKINGKQGAAYTRRINEPLLEELPNEPKRFRLDKSNGKK
jgi:hypothetical protein